MPKNAKELHSFLALTSYYCWFIQNFAHVANCLHQLIGPTNVKKTKREKVKKEVTTLDEKKLKFTQPTFVWASEHQKAFNALKVALTTAPVLGCPNFSRGIYPRNRCLTKRAGNTCWGQSFAVYTIITPGICSN